ncbi:MerR family transcriptional regulator [Spirillospora sp. NPDC048911]|uniref:MerR family transcriptional regulator n=1 Tax=Spirillospora sp. NPDC048911 TaxID=3364527 RepID=UPI003717716E
MAKEPSTRAVKTKAALRPVDLARMAGVSTQQIRNYADEGILPPTERTAAGYRRFEPRHREAMLTYRVLAKGFGWDAARSIMRALHAGGLAPAVALVDARHAALHEQRLSLHAAAEALEAVAGQVPEAPDSPRSGLRIGEVAAHLGVRTSALRVWEAAGLLAPQRERGTGYRRYGAADVRDARMVTMLRQGRYPLHQIQAVLDGLRRTGSTVELRAAIAERHAALNTTSAAMLEGTAHLYRYVTDHLPDA